MLTPIPLPLCAWLTLLAQAVPNRSALTFLELLLGAMITDRGFVTEALLAITPRRKWPTYFKWLEGTLLHGYANPLKRLDASESVNLHKCLILLNFCRIHATRIHAT